MNKIFLVGRLADDPKPFTTKNGNAQSRITIATQDNRVRTESYFFPCIAWQNSANFINTYLKKGDLVAIDGKLTRRNYVSKEGKNASITEIVIESINSIGSKKDNQSAIINKDNNVLQTKPIELESTKASTIGEVDWAEDIEKE